MRSRIGPVPGPRFRIGPVLGPRSADLRPVTGTKRNHLINNIIKRTQRHI